LRLAFALALVSCTSTAPSSITIEPKTPAAQAPVRGELEPDGAELMKRFGCIACHDADERRVGPRLRSLFGARVALADGRVIIADEDYVVRSIFDPRADVVEGYLGVAMPSFRGAIDDTHAHAIARYIRTLR